MADESKGGGLGGFIVAMVIVAVVGGGAGFSLKFVLPPRDAVAADVPAGKAPATGATDAHAAHPEPPAKQAAEPAAGQVLPLEAIIVSLSAPHGVRLRLESAVLFAEATKTDRGVLLREMAQDFATYLRTVKLAQIETASGIEYLREDLAELVQLRSKGLARGIVIKSLMVE